MSDQDPIDATLATEDGPAPSPATGAAIRDAIAADIAPVKAMSLTTRAGLVLGAAGLALVVAVATFGAAGLGALSTNVPGCSVALTVALVGTAALAASFAPSLHERFDQRVKAGLVLLLIGVWTYYVFDLATTGAVAAVDKFAIGCAVRALGAGVVAGATMMWIWRRTDPWTPRASGALIGAAAGCLGAAGVGIPCASHHAGHLAVGHWMVVPILAIAGAAMARRALAP